MIIIYIYYLCQSNSIRIILVTDSDSLGKRIGIQGKRADMHFEIAVLQVKNRGFTKMKIHTSDDNTLAQNLYKKCSYTVTEIKEGANPDGTRQMAYTFEKNL